MAPRVGEVVEIDSGIMGIVRVKVLRVEGAWIRVLDDEDPDATGEFWWPLSKLLPTAAAKETSE